jgi:hypothetical protein
MEAGRRERMEALRVKGEVEAAEREKEMEKDEDIWGGDDEQVSWGLFLVSERKD